MPKDRIDAAIKKVIAGTDTQNFDAIRYEGYAPGGIADLTPREIAIFAPLVLLTIYYGVQPGPILDACAASVALLVKNFDAAVAATKTAALALN